MPTSKSTVKATKPKAKRPATMSQSSPDLMSSTVMGQVLKTLENTYDFHPMAELTRNNPYKVLVACVLSLRTKDEVMIPASERLFKVADTPESMLRLDPETIEKLVYPVGFYKTKARSILDFSQVIMDEFGGQVPDTIDELLTLKGVGRKTANLVVGLGHQLPAICVDVHVHRICNRLGYIQTKTPDETEMVLRAKLPQQYWAVINTVMVLHGQQTCRPIGPRCDVCPVADVCHKVDVKPRAVKKTASAKP